MAERQRGRGGTYGPRVAKRSYKVCRSSPLEVDYDARVQRRSFLVGGISGTALIGCKPWTAPIEHPEPLDQHELDTLAAMADTFLPGDDGTPGAHEVNALATIVDPAHGLTPYISELVADLDQWCLMTKLRAFQGLSASDREVALEQRMGLRGKLVQSLYRPAYEGVLALTKLAFFGGLSNKLGTSYLAFPGPSRGYAPGSAAGAYSSSERPWAIAVGRGSSIRVDGAGTVSAVRVSAFATASDDVTAMLRVSAPGGGHHDLPLRANRDDALIDDVLVPLTGGPAAGSWRLEVTTARGIGRLELWSLRVRTELDDRASNP